MKSRLYFVRTLTSTHIGTGRGEGAIDLPIAREAASGIPYIPGSAIKGVLRDEPDLRQHAAHRELFGPEPDSENQDLHQGSLVFNDARLLVLPVRSLKGMTAWLTCPHVLRLLCDSADAADIGIPDPKATEILADAGVLSHDAKVMLDEIDLDVAEDNRSLRKTWATRLMSHYYGAQDRLAGEVEKRFAIVADETFAFFCEMATDVRARVRLTAERTVKSGALWYEENLPPETLLYGIWGAQERPRKQSGRLGAGEACETLASNGQPRTLQIGGKATVGRGSVRVEFGGNL